MKINKIDAQRLCNYYINFGNENHFKYGGDSITGFIFKRGELVTLLSGDKELFLMLALSPDGGMLPNRYLNIVIGGVLNDYLDETNLIISDGLPHTLTVGYEEGTSVKSLFDVITVEQFNAMHSHFASAASNDHLTSSNGVKVKAYKVKGQDLTDLRLSTEGNENDLFIFMPVIRPLYELPYDRAYLSLAVARFNRVTSKVSGTIIEYCLPCPTACPTNYPFK